jgi:DNA-binding MarR family transcriptional regulator
MESQTDMLALVFRLGGRIRREFAGLMSAEQWAIDANLRPGCFGVLRQVNAAGHLSQRAIAEGMGVGASDMVALVDRLQAAGYVRREQDPSDRRRNVVVITPEGRDALKRLEKVAAVAEERVLAPLSPDDRVAFGRLLALVVAGDCPSSASDS